MIFRLLVFIGLYSSLSLLRAQTIDPGFKPIMLSTPGNVRCVVQQPDGKYVALGSFKRNESGSIGLLVRFNADFTIDQSFNATVASLAGTLFSVRALSSGKLLVVGEGTLTIAGVARQDLLRLNADGTPDTSFDAGTASTTGLGPVVEPLPNGQLLIGGSFTSYNGATRNKLVRLTTTGSVDATFTPATLTATVKRVAVQADGNVLVGGADGLGLLRLTPNGSADASFSAPTIRQTDDIVVQPNGSIIVGGAYAPAFGDGASLVRLLPNGSHDVSFLSNVVFTPFNTTDQRLLLLQPDGRLLVATLTQGLVRLHTNGGFDTSFQQLRTSRSSIAGLAATASGQLLVAGSNFELPSHRSGVALLNTDGSLDTHFAPTLLTDGYIYALEQQADGKILAGGSFDEVNGQLVNNLVRFTADGTLDASFVAPRWLNVQQLILQPDGKLLVAQFARTSQPAVLRLLATGAVDPSFVAPAATNRVNQLLLQPDGKLLVLVDTVGHGTTLPTRLTVTGRVDHTFAPLLNSNYDNAMSAALQPDGKLLLAGSFDATATKATIRLLSTGQRDPSFSELSVDNAPEATNIVLQPDGKILLVDNFYNRLRRLTASGQLDASFTAALPSDLEVYTLRTQPNNRILVGGYSRYLARLLPNGSLDNSFTSPTPNNTVTDVQITPAGQLLVSGYFTTFDGQPRGGLVRLITTQILAVPASQAVAHTQAYPNPAHAALHLLLDADARPQRVVLFDVLGQPVLTRQATTASLTLDTSCLRPGSYLLRVDYAASAVTRRISIE